jgi:sugar phosphate isomerase/epimerase
VAWGRYGRNKEMEGRKEDVKLELRTEVECKRLASPFGFKWKTKARVCTSEETKDRGQSGMWFKRLTELLDIFEDALFSDVTLSILIVIHHHGKNPLIVTSMRQIGLAKFLRNVDNLLQITRRHIPQD